MSPLVPPVSGRLRVAGELENAPEDDDGERKGNQRHEQVALGVMALDWAQFDDTF